MISTDLMERCLPPDAPDGNCPEPAIVRRAAELAVRALGVARAAHIRAHFTRGRYPGLPEALAALEREGTLVRVAVEGLGVEGELERLAAWRGATEIEVRAAPAAWRPILAA